MIDIIIKLIEDEIADLVAIEGSDGIPALVKAATIGRLSIIRNKIKELKPTASQKLEKQLAEAQELLVDVFIQATSCKSKYCHAYISAYENAQEYLIREGYIEEEDCEYTTGGFE